MNNTKEDITMNAFPCNYSFCFVLYLLLHSQEIPQAMNHPMTDKSVL